MNPIERSNNSPCSDAANRGAALTFQNKCGPRALHRVHFPGFAEGSAGAAIGIGPGGSIPCSLSARSIMIHT